MDNEGFTLIEILIVFSILVIIATIAIPRYVNYSDIAKGKVCCANCKIVERSYEAYLVSEDLNHTEILFNQYIIENFNELCPDEGLISYIDGEVYCSIHKPIEETDDEEIPFL